MLWLAAQAAVGMILPCGVLLFLAVVVLLSLQCGCQFATPE